MSNGEILDLIKRAKAFHITWNEADKIAAIAENALKQIDIKDQRIAQLQADYANASAEAAACVKFLESELGWSDFREEMLGDTASGKNIAKLQAFLKERGGHGAKLLADYNSSQQTVRESEARFDSLADAVYKLAGQGDFHHPWDAIGGVEKIVRELRKQVEHLAFCFEPECCGTCRNIREAIDAARAATDPAAKCPESG